MTDIQPFSSQSIIDCLKANYGLGITALMLLPLGEATHLDDRAMEKYL